MITGNDVSAKMKKQQEWEGVTLEPSEKIGSTDYGEFYKE